MMEMKVNGFELLNHFSIKQAMVLNCKTIFQRESKQAKRIIAKTGLKC